MTRYLPLMPAALLATAGSAQLRKPFVAAPEPSHWEQPEAAAPAQGDDRDGGDTVFFEDFANGLAGNNGVGAWTVSGPDGAVWQHDNDGPNGDFSSTQERIQSPTVSNGFMIFDSNLSNNGCVATNSCVTRNGFLETPVIDLSAVQYAHLQWHQRLRWCCSGASGHFVDVSTDGGATWPTRIPAIKDQVVNYDPGTYVMRVNLRSAIAANPANVRIRFAHDGNATGNLSHYHWQIDDVRITESYDNDIGMIDPRYASFVPNDTDTDVLDFTVYPHSQLRPLSMGTPVRNEGKNDATGVALDMEVRNPSNQVIFTGSPTGGTLLPDQVTELRTDFTPPAVDGELRVNFNLVMNATDERPVDNTAERRFRVSPSIYAYDNGARDGQYDRPASGGVYPEYYAGNLFWIENTATAHGVQIALASGSAGSGTAVGAVFDGIILDFSVDPPAIVAETDITSVTSTSQLSGTGQARWFNLNLLAPTSLQAGKEYAVCIRTYGGTNRCRVATSGIARPVSSLRYEPDNTQWFILNQRPMVRLSFAPFVGLEEATSSGAGTELAQNMPNPADGITSVAFSLEATANARLQVHDVSGKLVMDLGLGQRAPGRHRVDLDVSALQDGVYLYSLIAGEQRITKRMTVVH